jgi:hypothetical protein
MMHITMDQIIPPLKKSLLISSILMLFIYGGGGSPNPLTWRSHVDRFISPQQLVQPDVVSEFAREIDSTVSDPHALFELVEQKIEYKSDLVTHASIQHLSTTEEVLQSREDDCDGIAVLVCSLLRFKGYTAYAVMGPTHAWVEYEDKDDLVSIDYRGGDWFVRFNESTTEWNLQVFILSMGKEFVFLNALIGLILYSYERGIITRIKEFIGYFQYILPLVLIAGVTAIIILTFWVPGILLVSIACLIVTEIIARLRPGG